MDSRAPRAVRCFTLVEMLTVIAIIAILAAIGVGGYFLATNSMQNSRTRTAITVLDTALKSLESKFGFYPQAHSSGYFVIRSSGTVSGLTPDNIDLGQSNYPPAYLNSFVDAIDFEQLRNMCEEVGGVIVVIDAWDKPLEYRRPGTVNVATFDIESAGPDGSFGTSEDNIGNF